LKGKNARIDSILPCAGKWLKSAPLPVYLELIVVYCCAVSFTHISPRISDSWRTSAYGRALAASCLGGNTGFGRRRIDGQLAGFCPKQCNARADGAFACGSGLAGWRASGTFFRRGGTGRYAKSWSWLCQQEGRA
jgi:hypothetical protein